MTTLVLNAGVIAWVSLLLFGPYLLLHVAGTRSVIALAGSGLATMALLCLVGVSSALFKNGTLIPLRICSVLLAVVLILGIWRQIRRARTNEDGLGLTIDDLAYPGSLAIGVALLAPPFIGLNRLGVRFGVATVYNADIASYIQSAYNVARSGFGNSHHIVGLIGSAPLDVGSASQRGSYFAPTMMINLVSAATGLSTWQAALPAMGVSLTLVAVSLWALAKAIWPTSRYAAGGAALVGSMASLPTFAIAQFYLGAVLGLASVAGGLAGATELARGDRFDRSALSCLMGGAALGVYAYAELGLPALIALPVWAVIAHVLFGGRRRDAGLRILVLGVASAILALIVASVSLPTASNLINAQSKGVAGFRIPTLTASAAILWPAGIRQGVVASSMTLSWLVLLALVVAGCVTAWRHALRGSALVTALLAGGALIVMLGFFKVYGTNRYQTWKMEAFLLPMVLAAIVPAIAMIRVKSASVGKAVVLGTAGLVAVSPALQWQRALGMAGLTPRYGGQPFFSQRALVDLAKNPQLSGVQSINIHLAPLVETELAGSIVPVRTVTFTQQTYSPIQKPLKTCTLTRRSMVKDLTGAIDLGGGYVLIPRPYPCQLKK